MTAVGCAVYALLVAGLPPVEAVAVAVAATVGGVQVGCRLTMPLIAPKTVVSVLITVLVVIVSVVQLGYPALECLAVVLASSWCAAELARRVTAAVFQLHPAAV